jgi:hypothetical protein
LRFYSNENSAPPVVTELRRLGHDVLTSLEAGNANASAPDAEVLAFASAGRRTYFNSTTAEPRATPASFCVLSMRISRGKRDESA